MPFSFQTVDYTTATSTTTTRTTTTTARPSTTSYTTQPLIRHSDPPVAIINNVKKFMRYYIPPEVQITHSQSLKLARSVAADPKKKKSDADSGISIDDDVFIGAGGPRNMRSDKKEEEEEEKES
jgi:hypothetical protein